jgi:hypothetical protein
MELHVEVLVGQRSCASTCDDQRILVNLKMLPLSPEELPQFPFDAVSNHRIPHFGADRDAKTSPQLVVLFADDDEVVGKGFLPRS